MTYKPGGGGERGIPRKRCETCAHLQEPCVKSYQPVTEGQRPKRRKGADHFGYGQQVHLGKTKDGDGLWHSGGKYHPHPDTYWCGRWGDRTPEELLSECISTLEDLRIYHPELFPKKGS